MKAKVDNSLRNECIARRYFLSDESSLTIGKDYNITRQRAFKIAHDYVKKHGPFEVTK